MSVTVVLYSERHTCTYGMNLTYNDPITNYDDLEVNLVPEHHDDWWDDRFPSSQRCWKQYRQTQYHNPEPSPKKEQS